MKLYDYWRSGASYRVRIALKLKGLDADYVPIHLVKDGGQQHSESYKALNPQELVPTLESKDWALTQSMAILEYLEETHPEPALLPKDPIERAKVRALAQVIATDTHPIQNLRVLKRLKSMGHDQEAINAWASHWIQLGYQAVEAHLERTNPDGPYLFGKEVTLADVVLVPQIVNAKRFGTDLSSVPKTLAVIDSLMELPAFSEPHPDNHPHTGS